MARERQRQLGHWWLALAMNNDFMNDARTPSFFARRVSQVMVVVATRAARAGRYPDKEVTDRRGAEGAAEASTNMLHLAIVNEATACLPACLPGALQCP